jgi:hypothetical protein
MSESTFMRLDLPKLQSGAKKAALLRVRLHPCRKLIVRERVFSR